MRHELVGDHGSAPALGLDHETFSYAGKFDGEEGKFVTRDSGETVAALSFSPDGARDGAARVRYIAVRDDRRDEGIASSLLAHSAERLTDDLGYDAVRMGANRPFAYTAAHNAGFVWTGEEAGLGELVVEYPSPPSNRSSYKDGLCVFSERDLGPDERSHVEDRL